MKCILFLNRIPATKVRHNLGAALQLLKEHAPFEIRISESSRQFIKRLDTFGRFRYLETSFQIVGPEVAMLDKTIWEIRRYCTVLDYEIVLADGSKKSMLEAKLKEIADSENYPPQALKLIGGKLEVILADKKHPARKGLVWQNLYFGLRTRNNVRLARSTLHLTNSPLSLHPEILDEVLHYIFLPKEVIDAYRAEQAPIPAPRQPDAKN